MAESDDKSKQQVTLGDQPSAVDTLGFTPYVIAIAEFLTSDDTKPPLTLSIEGEWGSGKSSFMKQLEAQIQKISGEKNQADLRELGEKVKFWKTGRISWNKRSDSSDFFLCFVRNSCDFLLIDLRDISRFLKLKFGLKQKTQTICFNAWRHDKAESLWAAFALSFLESISKNRDRSDIIPNFFSHISLLGSRLDWRNNFFGIIQKIATSAFVLGAAVTIPYLYFSDGKARIEAFSGNITCQLEEKDQCQNQPLLNILLFLMGGGGSFSATFLLLGKFRALIGDAKLDLTEYLESPDYDSQIAFIEKFHGDFSKIVNAYAGKEEKIYVFIDDLDRCELGKSADLLQALNMMISNDPNLIFILGMDREKVAAAITYKQKDLLPFLNSISGNGKDLEQSVNNQLMKKLDYGFSFMEKFVQLTFSVPKPSEKILTDFLSTISTVSPQKNTQEKEIQVKKFFWLTFKNISSLKIVFIQKIQKLILKKWQSEESTTIDHPEHNNQSPQNTEKIFRELAIFPIVDWEMSPEDLQKIIEMVAPFFDYNTRRLKQYINLLRLKTYILHYSVGVTWEEAQNPLTIEQIGKFTAITSRYPRLLLCLEDDYSLLERMEQSVSQEPTLEGDSDAQELSSNDLSYWINEPRLKKLISYELSDKKFSLRNQKTIKHLLQVSSRLELDPKYFKLRSFLANKQFKEADEETDRVMLQVMGKEPYTYQTPDDIKCFPCKDLKIIDDLWKRYSNDKFGFSMQKHIWLDCGGITEYDEANWINNYEKFATKLEWTVVNEWGTDYRGRREDYDNFDFTIGGVQGHLPIQCARYLVGNTGSLYILSRMAMCEL